jgi:hypothetical protein
MELDKSNDFDWIGGLYIYARIGLLLFAFRFGGMLIFTTIYMTCVMYRYLDALK